MQNYFQARAGLSIADVGNPFVPKRLGTGIMDRDPDLPLIALYLEGRFADDPDNELSFTIALDVERTVGTLAQLRVAMRDLGVSDEDFDAMLAEAHRRIGALRAMDRAPEESS